MALLELHFVRHGQTDCSRENRYCGEIDTPLNAAGHAMAAALAQAYGHVPWVAIYSSPKLRARQTAQPVADRAGVPVRIEDGLREIAYGAWDGMLASEIRERFPHELAAWESDPARVAPPGGETGLEIAARAMPVVERILSRHADGKVLVVSHKATLRAIACMLLGIELRHFRSRIGQQVGALTVFTMRSTGPMLKVHGDNSYLPPELREEVGT